MGLEQLGTRDIPICTFNRITCFKTPAASDCGYFISMFHMPHGYCCLEECGEHDGVRESKPARFILHAAPHFFYRPGVPVTNEKILAWMPRETIGEED